MFAHGKEAKMGEIWDAYDIKMNIIPGKEMARGEPREPGMFHIVSDVAVRHEDGEYLVMQRDLSKRFGGLWELTAGGSALKGETSLQCAERELFEETGIIGALIELGKETDFNHQTHHIAYLCTTDCDKNAVTLQEGETIAFKWVGVDELAGMELSSNLTRRLLGIEE